MTFTARTRKVLRDLLMAEEEKRQIEETDQADRRLTRSVDNFERTVTEFLKCTDGKRHGPVAH